jgi:hypothetical protein
MCEFDARNARRFTEVAVPALRIVYNSLISAANRPCPYCRPLTGPVCCRRGTQAASAVAAVSPTLLLLLVQCRTGGLHRRLSHDI